MLSHFKRIVPLPIKRLYHQLKNPDHLQPEKVALVDLAVEVTGARSMAYLGVVNYLNVESDKLLKEASISAP